MHVRVVSEWFGAPAALGLPLACMAIGFVSPAASPPARGVWTLTPMEMFFVAIGAVLTLLVLGLFAGIILMAVRERPDGGMEGPSQPTPSANGTHPRASDAESGKGSAPARDRSAHRPTDARAPGSTGRPEA